MELDQSASAGAVLDNRLQLQRLLGEGGMGEVYLAHNVKLQDVQFAVKVLRPALAANERLVRRLESEARTQSRLRHKHIVRVFELLNWQDRRFLVLDYVEGTTLEARIGANPRGMGETEALALVVDVLAALNHAHEHGVLHCDVKPANVLIDADGQAHLTDFGIARNLWEAGAENIVGGTPAYMSPEQVAHPDRIDHRSDVYSAGMMLFEMLTGRLPFDHDTPHPCPQAALPPLRLRQLRPDLPEGLERIVGHALATDRSQRFQGCLDFLSAIERYRAWRRWKRTWLPLLGVLAVIGGGAYAKVRHDEEEAQRRTEQAQAQSRSALAQQRQAIAASIANAMTGQFKICLDSARLAEKRKGLAIAREQGPRMKDLASRFEAQVRDIEANLGTYTLGYDDALATLAASPALAQEGLRDFRLSAEADSWMRDAVRDDLQAHRFPRTLADLQGNCRHRNVMDGGAG
jgi:hypothetical protein